MVVNLGTQNCEDESPSNPATEMSSGMRSPMSNTARMAPMAMASPNAKIAERSGERMMRRTAAS